MRMLGRPNSMRCAVRGINCVSGRSCAPGHGLKRKARRARFAPEDLQRKAGPERQGPRAWREGAAKRLLLNCVCSGRVYSGFVSTGIAASLAFWGSLHFVRADVGFLMASPSACFPALASLPAAGRTHQSVCKP